MARRSATLGELADAAGMELDEAIVTLWDAGIEYVQDPRGVVRSGDIPRAQRALGIATSRQLKSAEYWREALGKSEFEFAVVLEDLGVTLPLGATHLPKGAVAKLKKLVRGRQLRPVQTVPEAVAVEVRPFVWEVVGRERGIRHLTADEVLKIHEQLIVDFAASDDPIDPPGVRDPNLLESAVFRPHTSLGDDDKYPTVEMGAAALVHSLVHDHPFHNGNKRSAVVAMLVLLDENGLVITSDELSLFKFILQVAQHRLVPRTADYRDDREVMAIAQWICEHSRRVERGERNITWRRLKRILAAFECTWELARGNRMNLYRVVGEPGLFGRTRRRDLQTRVHYRDDGTELTRTSLNKIRHDLWLDDEHGVDSKSFYEADVELAAADFIAQYSKILHRLARL